MESQVLDGLSCRDWRSLSPDAVAPLYTAEVERWASALEWESRSSWEEVERGRRLGTVSGLVVSNEHGDVVGWSYYLLHHGALQVGGLVASTDRAVDLMLDAILSERTLAAVTAVTFFAFDNQSGLRPALERRGLATNRYLYLGRPEAGLPLSYLSNARPWRPDDMQATAELLASAYGGADEARPFAPGGTIGEWQEYVGQLTGSTGCGALLPSASFCIPDGQNRLVGLVITTRVASTSGHIAQLVVDPLVQGRRLGAGLIDLACAAAAAVGCRRVTLLVGEQNHRARRLYERAGFEPMASFLAAGAFSRGGRRASRPASSS